MQSKEEKTKAIASHWLFAAMPLLTVGIIDLLRAWYKHDLADAIFICLIFFVGAPLYLIAWRSRSGTAR